MKLVDTLIYARWIVPIDDNNQTLEHHCLVIDKGRILDILPNDVAEKKYHAATEERLKDHVLIPGLINSHTHTPMNLMRGIADDLPLMEWLEHHIWPLEQKWMGEEFVKEGTDLAIAEMLRGGTTCFNDMYFFPEISAHQAIKAGIRASIGLILIDFPSAWAKNREMYIEKGLALHHRLKDEPLITTAFAPHAPYTVSDKPLEMVAAHANDLNIRIHMHVHETEYEIHQQRQQTNETPLERLERLGLLHENFIAVHMTQLSEEEIKIYAKTGAHIVHCPESNLKLASGFCPASLALASGINVALGTDSAASNNDLDMFGEMRTAALLAKGVTKNASAFPAMTVLKMATINGAKALGLDDEIGSLSLGKSADIVAVNLDELETQPLYNIISQLVYSCSRQQVSDVWIAGKRVLKKRQLTTLDLNELKLKSLKWQQRLSAFN
jgi:5-methylthioadenosine/S-adenosylhomocysteine deaminase